jgi:predicted nucleic acid-binding protein
VKTLILDTNVILRYLANDVPKKADDCEKLFRDAGSGRVRLFVSDICIAELVWTLKSYFHLDNDDIYEKITAIINTPGFHFTDEALILDAMMRFKDKNVDFADAYTASLAARDGMKISSYDRDYRKFSDVTAIEPPEFE